MESIIIDGIFNKKYFDLSGYSLIEVSKGKALSEKFRSSLDVQFDMSRLVEVCDQRGLVYAYVRKGRVKAIYFICRNVHAYTCNESYYSHDIVKRPIVDRLDQHIAFKMAKSASSHKDGTAVFKDTVMPALIIREHGFDWVSFASFALIFSITFYSTLHFSGIIVGILFGIAMGFAFRNVDYHYEGHKVGKSLGSSKVSEVTA